MTNMTSSSPHSSEEATHHDTPSTSFTVFSPETAHNDNSTGAAQQRFNLSVTTDGLSTANTVTGSNSGHDVFLNEPVPTSAHSQLSPVAEAFTPGQYIIPQATHASTASVASYMSGGRPQTVAGRVSIEPSSGTAHGYPTPVSSLVAGSVPEMHAYSRAPAQNQREPRSYITTPADAAQMVGPARMFYEGLRNFHIDSHHREGFRTLANVFFMEGTFTTDDMTGRAVMVNGVPPDFSCESIGALFSSEIFMSLKRIILLDLKTHGVIYIGFNDIRDAAKVEPVVNTNGLTWTVRRLSPRQWSDKAACGQVTVLPVSNFEGQLIVTVFYDGNETRFLAAPIVALLKQTLATFGDIKALHAMAGTNQHHVRDFRVEYEDVRAADNALFSLNNAFMGGFVLEVKRYEPDLCPPQTNVAHYTPVRPLEQLSLTGRSTIPMHEHDRLMMDLRIRDPDPFDAPRSRSSRYDLNGNHNQIVIARIQAGLDVRTTIMLRNIPNKIDQAMLKEILDETSHGSYDFMYLRIVTDFANNCNVGYAFINFVDALAIIPFALARAGQRWNRFNSDKVAEISYATIQGKDCLVQKFRNSSVMLECPTFRPKLFTTGTGPDAGQEDRFPGPDNVSKMRRSVENAEHVGLYRSYHYESPPSSPPRWRLRGIRPALRGVYGRPARAAFAPSTTMVAPAPLTLRLRAPDTTPAPVARPVPIARPAPVILTPASTPGSVHANVVDTSRADNPFYGNSSLTGIPPVVPRSVTNVPSASAMRLGTQPDTNLNRLFAPRQGQAYREEQRRRRSQFDRGTPGAEYEAYSHRLTDPALSPIRTPYTPLSAPFNPQPGPYGYGNGPTQPGPSNWL